MKLEKNENIRAAKLLGGLVLLKAYHLCWLVKTVSSYDIMLLIRTV